MDHCVSCTDLLGSGANRAVQALKDVLMEQDGKTLNGFYHKRQVRLSEQR